MAQGQGSGQQKGSTVRSAPLQNHQIVGDPNAGPSWGERAEAARDVLDGALDWMGGWTDWWGQRRAAKRAKVAGRSDVAGDTAPLKRTWIYKNLWWLRALLGAAMIGYSGRATITHWAAHFRPVFVARGGYEGLAIPDADGIMIRAWELPSWVHFADGLLWTIPDIVGWNIVGGLIFAFLLTIGEFALAGRAPLWYGVVVAVDALYTSLDVYPDIVEPMVSAYVQQPEGLVARWGLFLASCLIAFLLGLGVAYFGERFMLGDRKIARRGAGGGGAPQVAPA
jgi:hypothetical protein